MGDVTWLSVLQSFCSDNRRAHSIMNVSAPATKSKRKRAKTSRTGGNTKQPEPPRVNSTVDLIFSLMMMSVTPWLLILKFIVDLLRGRSSQRENKQNVSTIDTHSDAVLLKLNESVSGVQFIMFYRFIFLV